MAPEVNKISEEPKEWSKQFFSGFGPKELMRLTAGLLGAQFAGIILSVAVKNFGFALISIGLTIGVLWLSPYWQPAYVIVRKIMGNPNLPPLLPSYQRKWWIYISITLKLLMILAVLGVGFKVLFQ